MFRNITRRNRKGRLGARLAAAAVFAGLACAPADAHDWVWEKTLRYSTPQAGAMYGTAVACDSKGVLVSAPYWYTTGGEGRAEAWTKSAGGTWSVSRTYQCTSGDGYASFGLSLGRDGDYVVAGMPGQDSGKGEAKIFNASSWWSEHLTASDRDADDLFGWNVAVDDPFIVVGAPDDDAGGTDAGAVYIRSITGTSFKKLSGSAGYNLGDAVAIDGYTVAAGAPGTPGTSRGGAVRLYKYTTLSTPGGGSTSMWMLSKTISCPEAGIYNFGTSIALDGSTLVVGTLSSGAKGRAYVYDISGFVPILKATLQASDKEYGDDFGQAVAVCNDHILIGAPGKDNGATADAGAAYAFRKDGSGAWYQDDKLLAPDFAASDEFGWSVAIYQSGDSYLAAVGAPFAESAAAYAEEGQAYIFK